MKKLDSHALICLQEIKQLSRPVVQDWLVWKYKPNLLTVEVLLLLLQPWPDLFYSRLQPSALRPSHIKQRCLCRHQIIPKWTPPLPGSIIFIYLPCQMVMWVKRKQPAIHLQLLASLRRDRECCATGSSLPSHLGTVTLGPPPFCSKSLFLLRRALNIVQHNYSGRKLSSEHVLMHIHKLVLS